jgi:phosphatidylserine/phosphatidylglycerophosphate/cardiolipin synthase-like enzyme
MPLHLPLTLLEQKYFAASNYSEAAPEDAMPPIYRGTTEITPLIDGISYYPAVWTAIAATMTENDAVYLVGWRFNPGMDLLTGDLVPITSSAAIGNLLASKAAKGVDVRIVLNGTLVLYWVPSLWGENLSNAEKLREVVPQGSTAPPLAELVLFDWSGANQTGSHHQKAVVVRRGAEVTAFVCGMDMNPNIFDGPPHDAKAQVWTGTQWRPNVIPASDGGGKWGWHDISVRLVGEAAKRVLHNFRNRWEEASTLPVKKYTWPSSSTSREFNPASISETPAAVALDAAAPQMYKQSVQVLRSRFRDKIPNRCGRGGKAWSGLPDEPGATGPFYEIYATMKKAIAAATRYIYIEDQFLEDSLPGGQSVRPIDGLWEFEFSLFTELLNTVATALTPVRIIFVGSGRGDPEDPLPPQRNRTVTPSIQRVIDSLPPARRGNVTVWRRDRVTVHSKLMIIDDEFMTIGSANFQSRSMAGVDAEITAAIVAEDDLVMETRRKLWVEHFKLDQFLGAAGVQAGLDDMHIALGLWRPDWYPAELMYWQTRTGYDDTAGYGGLSRVYP